MGLKKRRDETQGKRSAVRGSGMCKTRSSLRVVFIHMSKCNCLIKIDLNAFLDTRTTIAVRATIILFCLTSESFGFLHQRAIVLQQAHDNEFTFQEDR